MSDRPAKPKEMSWASPMITLKNVPEALTFYEKAFGFEKAFEMKGDDGSIMHAEMRYRDQSMMFGPEWPGEPHYKAPTSAGGVTSGMYMYVEDVDAFFEKAKAAGAKVIEEVKDQFWGDRTCRLECPEGHRWMFGQNVADFDPSKVPGK